MAAQTDKNLEVPFETRVSLELEIVNTRFSRLIGSVLVVILVASGCFRGHNSSPLTACRLTRWTLSRWVDHWTADEVLLKEKVDDSALKDMVVEGSDEELGDDGD